MSVRRDGQRGGWLDSWYVWHPTLLGALRADWGYLRGERPVLRDGRPRPPDPRWRLRRPRTWSERWHHSIKPWIQVVLIMLGLLCGVVIAGFLGAVLVYLLAQFITR